MRAVRAAEARRTGAPRRLAAAVLAGLCAAQASAATPPALTEAPALAASRANSSGAFTSALRYAEQKLWSSPYATSSEVARRNTEHYLAGMVSQAFTFAQQLEQLATAYFNHGSRLDGLPGLYNPDNLYRSALLEPGAQYRITGRRGTHTDLSFQVLDRYPIVGLGRNLLVIRPDDHGVAPGGRFEILLGGSAPPRRAGTMWFPLPPEARAVLARQSFGDWQASASELQIERLDVPALRSSRSPPLDAAAEALRQIVDLWVDGYVPRIQRETPLNSLPAPRASDVGAGGLGGQQSVMARYRIGDDEALLITVRRSDAPYQAIQLGDPWFVTPNFVEHQVSLTSRQARADGDGLIRFVIALRDPGVPNWLDAAGNPEGYVFMRWQGLKAPLGAQDAPVARVVLLSALRSLLPSDTPVIQPEDRARQLAARRRPPLLR